VTFQIGDRVREGMHTGTVADVGTVLIQVKSDAGGLCVLCPWELVRLVADIRATIEQPDDQHSQ
jgi:hypothetical protein